MHAATVFLGSCGSLPCLRMSGAVHQLPEISQGNLGLAQTEVRARADRLLRRSVTDERGGRDPAAAPTRRICAPAAAGLHAR